MQWTIWNNLDDEGNPLAIGVTYALYNPEDPMISEPQLGPLAYYGRDDLGQLTFLDEETSEELPGIHKFDYAHAQNRPPQQTVTKFAVQTKEKQ